MSDKGVAAFGGIQCGCMALVLLVNLTLGGYATSYIVETVFHQKIDFILAAIIGLVGGELTMPIALIVYLLKLGGVTF